MEELVERPLPRPSSGEYASARLLEALMEVWLALDFLGRGLTRSAAGKAFQAWRAVLAALLRLELERLKAAARTEEERKWLEEKAVPRIPITRMVTLSQMLEELGCGNIAHVTMAALSLHDYQHHGPDPDMALSKYRTRGEAANAVRSLAKAVLRYVEMLKDRTAWTREEEEALQSVKEKLGAAPDKGHNPPTK